jgi:hypothetical protein
MLSNMGDSETDESKDDAEGDGNANMSEILEENEADVEAAIKDDKKEAEEMLEATEQQMESAKPTSPTLGTSTPSVVTSPSTGNQGKKAWMDANFYEKIFDLKEFSQRYAELLLSLFEISKILAKFWSPMANKAL